MQWLTLLQYDTLRAFIEVGAWIWLSKHFGVYTAFTELNSKAKNIKMLSEENDAEIIYYHGLYVPNTAWFVQFIYKQIQNKP